MNYRIIRNSFIAGVCAVLFASAALAADMLSTPATPEQVASLNALVEQVFGGIPEPDHKVDSALVSKVSAKGSVPVIVRLREGDQPYGFFADKTKPRSEVIAGLQSAVVSDVIAQTSGDEAGLHVKRFSIIPGMALLADPATLAALLENPNVIDIVEDVAVPLALSQSVPLIGAGADGSFNGYTGDGWAVAILDTGVDKTHPFLSGKVVSEACYSNYYGGGTSVCPGGVTQSTAVGSGVNCTGSGACFHGTHVAGIAAGKNATFAGVAKDADIIAIQVFTLFGSDLSSYTSDQVLGLERVYALRSTYQIASVNMSLSGGSSSVPCTALSAQKTIIDTLRAAGIATVIASGNDGYTSAIGSPACIDSAVSVGSTTKADAVSSFTNSAYFLSLLAPGESITSSVPGTGYGTASGTSMAAPHVAGAWAVLKQASPDAGVTDILTALQTTGKPITDTRTGAGNRVKPRIAVAEALGALDVCDDNTDCDDGIVCNGAETCSGGTCGAGTTTCAGGTPYCDEANDRCVECLDSTNCTDGVFCNGAETCLGGTCVDGTAPVCSGGTPYCDEANDKCSECLSNSNCTDGVFCNGVETCSRGICVSGTTTCSAGTPYCDEANDRCVACLNNSNCTDGVFCNGAETCSGETCVAGTAPCTGTTPICNESSDRCLECTKRADCQSGHTCVSNICIDACPLTVTQKSIYSAKLTKPKKVSLTITGTAGFNLYGAIDPGPFQFISSKPNIKKNTLKISLLVPALFPKGTYEIWVGNCRGFVTIQ